MKKLSDFEKVFGENADKMDLDELIAKIRNDFYREINTQIPESSMMSSAECVLYAIHKLLKDHLTITDLRSWEEKNK